MFSALAAGYAYSIYLNSALSLPALLAALGVFSVFATLQIFFTKELGRRFLVVILETIAFLAPFYEYDFRLLGAAAVTILIFYFWGTVSARKELENGLKIKFFRASRALLGKLVTALTLALVILYLQNWDQKDLFVSEKTFQSFFAWSADFSGKLYPELTLNSSFDKFAESVTKTQLREDPAFQALTPAAQKTALEQAARQASKGFAEKLGVVVLPDESLGSVVYDVILNTLGGWRDKFQGIFTALWIIAVFLILKGIGSIFSFLVGLVSFLIYQILLASDFAHVAGEAVTKEVIEF